jgi:hypothetical protein
MTVSDHWNEVLRCPNCALTGVAVLSQPNGSDSVLVETLPAGLVGERLADAMRHDDPTRPGREMRENGEYAEPIPFAAFGAARREPARRRGVVEQPAQVARLRPQPSW